MNYTKVKWFLGISLVFLLILATNLIDRNSFREVRDSSVAIYEDRLLTKNVLFDLSMLTHEKALASARMDTNFYQGRNQLVNQQIDTLLESFRDVHLTQGETKNVDLLERSLDKLAALERSSAGVMDTLNHAAIEIELNRINKRLLALSEIQIREGRTTVAAGQNAVNSMELMTRIELYILIFLAVIVQIIVLYTPKRKRKKEEASA